MQVPQPKYFLFTSCKGGVGKSTCAANTAAALAKNGHKSLLCDCNFDMRCLDLLLGLENEVICDLADLALERVKPERAVIKCDLRDNLAFLPAPFEHGDLLSTAQLEYALKAAASTDDFEFVIIDTPGALVSPALLATGLVTQAVIVATHSASSIRAADMTGDLLAKNGIDNQRLIINLFDADAALSGALPGINEIIDRSFVRLGGIVPFDKALAAACELGKLAFESTSSGAARVNKNTVRAFDNLAARIAGEYTPLFDGFSGFGVKNKLKRLLKK